MDEFGDLFDWIMENNHVIRYEFDSSGRGPTLVAFLQRSSEHVLPQRAEQPGPWTAPIFEGRWVSYQLIHYLEDVDLDFLIANIQDEDIDEVTERLNNMFPLDNEVIVPILAEFLRKLVVRQIVEGATEFDVHDLEAKDLAADFMEAEDDEPEHLQANYEKAGHREAADNEAESLDSKDILTGKELELVLRSIASSQSHHTPVEPLPGGGPTLDENRTMLLTMFEENYLPAELINFVDLVGLTTAIAADLQSRQSLMQSNFDKALKCRELLEFREIFRTFLGEVAKDMAEHAVHERCARQAQRLLVKLSRNQ